MDTVYHLFVLFCFLAVALALEGGYIVWNNSRGSEALRLQRRLRATAAGNDTSASKLIRQRSEGELPALERWLLRLPRVRQLERLMEQAGWQQSVTRLLSLSLLSGATAFLVAYFLHLPLWITLALTTGAAAYPLIRLLSARRQRLRQLEKQLPDALDLIGRALRAGHAFSAALGMVGSEAAEPTAGEFRTTFDEVNFGIPLPEALHNLSVRVPNTDLRYFVVAVLLQRETGGNLAELLDNLSALIRARFKLIGAIRALSAEGRLSAWILTALPFVAAAAFNVINPQLMGVLWTDPVGPRLVAAAGVLVVIGIFWMWRTVKIRV